MQDVTDMVRWAAQDFVFNLEAIPADKLDWKPSPEAKSAYEIAGEVAMVAISAVPVLQGGEWAPTRLDPPTSLDEAKRIVLEHAEAFADAYEKADPAQLQRTLDLPFGKFVAARFVLFPLIEFIHHRGQITYIQSLLGDKEVRFDPAASDRFFNPGGAASE